MHLLKTGAVILLAAGLLVLAGCGGSEPDDEVIIEQGSGETDANTDTEQFINKGENVTLEGLAAAQSEISSYYFEQNLPYLDSAVFMRVWYYDNKMLVITSIDGELQTKFYYDYDKKTRIAYSPADGEVAIGSEFSPDDEDAPANPLLDDYLSYTLLGTEVVNRQLCGILETPVGDKLWVSAKYGFPMQVEFVDQMGDRYTVEYRNLEINTVTEDQVTVPDDLQVEFVSDTGE